MNTIITKSIVFLFIIFFVSVLSVMSLAQDEASFTHSELNSFRRLHKKLNVSELYPVLLSVEGEEIRMNYHLFARDLQLSEFIDADKDGFLTEDEFNNGLHELKKWVAEKVYLSEESKHCPHQVSALSFNSFYFDEPVFRIEAKFFCPKMKSLEVHNTLYSKLQYPIFRMINIQNSDGSKQLFENEKASFKVYLK